MIIFLCLCSYIMWCVSVFFRCFLHNVLSVGLCVWCGGWEIFIVHRILSLMAARVFVCYHRVSHHVMWRLFPNNGRHSLNYNDICGKSAPLRTSKLLHLNALARIIIFRCACFLVFCAKDQLYIPVV